MKNRYHQVTRISYFALIAMLTFPLVDFYMPWFVTAIPLLCIIIFSPQSRKNIGLVGFSILLVSILGLIQFYGVYRDRDFFNYYINLLISFSPMYICIYLKEETPDFSNKVVVFTLFCALTTSITTIVGLYIYPGASRELASGNAIYDTNRYKMINIGGYDFIYSLLLLIPFAVYKIKIHKTSLRIVYLIMLILFMFCIIKSSYTIALVLSLAILVLSFFKKIKKTFLILFIMLILLLLIDSYILADIIKFIQFITPSEYVKDRLQQLVQLFSGQKISTLTTTERLDHYITNLEIFASNPLFGANFFSFNRFNITGHSTILDILSSLGIIGLILCTCLFIKLISLINKKNRFSNYIFIVLFGFITISIFNISIYFSILLPLFLSFIYFDNDFYLKFKNNVSNKAFKKKVFYYGKYSSKLKF